MPARLNTFFASPLAPIFLVVFTDVLGMGMAIPVLPLFAKEELSATPAQVALMQSVYFVAQFLAVPWLGRWSDRVGRKPVLVFSQLGTLLCMLLTAWAPNLWVVYLARALDGLTAGSISVAFAYVGDVSDSEQRARSMGVINAGFGAGFMFGPALGGLLGGSFGPRIPFLAAACVSAVSISLSAWRLREPDKRISLRPPATTGEDSIGQRVSQALHALPDVRRLFSIGFGMQFALLTFTSTWVLWADAVLMAGSSPQETTQMVGFLYTCIGACGLLTQAFVVGPAVRIFGERRLIAMGLAMRSLGFFLIGAFPRLPITFAAIPVASVGAGVATPSLMATLVGRVPDHRRGQAMGTMNACESAGRVMGPLLAGPLYQHIAPAAPLFAASALFLLTALLARGISAKASARPPPKEAHDDPRTLNSPSYPP